MPQQTTTKSLNGLLQDRQRITKQDVAHSNKRIKGVMKKTVRTFQKKQRTSLEKAAHIVLNA